MRKPIAQDYSTGAERQAFARGVKAANRYLATLSDNGYTAAIERADNRNEPQSWYDGWDTITNSEYFAD